MFVDSINIKILNAGAWARSSDRVTVSLPMELEDYIPQVEEFYRLKHSGRKLQWHHLMSNGSVSTITYCRTHNLRVCLYIEHIACGSASLYIKMLYFCSVFGAVSGGYRR